MVLSRTVLFYAAPPVILGTLVAIYQIWFAGEPAAPPAEPPAVPSAVAPSPLAPFGEAAPATAPSTAPAAAAGGLAPAPDRTAPPAETPAGPVQDLAQAARRLRDLAGSLYSAFPEVAAWAADPKILTRLVAAADNVAQGQSPRWHLSFLAPSRPFSATQTAAGWVMAPESCSRYDRAVEIACSGSAETLAGAFRQLEPALDLAYRGLGYGEGSCREVLGRAAGELLRVPVPAEAIQVVPVGQGYVYADPVLEGQSEAGKHLLRLGPANARRLQERLRELAAAAGIAVPEP
ncbi:MAG: DUF3014 domain-containing protein [Chloroflexi bacterium]|nr:DUF3014 domain-containing protein [Chloroflexota bacterium]